MKKNYKEKMINTIKNLNLPKYEEIPNVGLYLEQVTKYINDLLEPIEDSVTSSMLSNYVKKGLVNNAVKKQYSRDNIAYFIFITLAKNIISLDRINKLIQIQKNTYSSQIAYNYFILEFENVNSYVFGFQDELKKIGGQETDEKILLRNTVIALSHKIYMTLFFRYYN